ncbi:receptor subunit 1 [Seminavis robusta]|uniref:Receptor subunit 1 n=1 Tax=Seminavis robusta TaxID=568900 RepID=A0A9N8E2S7_9STRA|nr:receptor subunit 1 [Seminavis robusta]|eukprot:Sro468_g149240.1 receptor subunit 1 (697) ;mRNA; f:59925-62302
MNRGVPTFALLLVALIVASLPCIAQAKGGEIGQIPVLNLGGDFAGGNARQNICDRYEDFATGKTQLRDALSRMKLHALLMNDEFLSYTAKEGLSPEDPGIIAEIMDVLAERANFTWRDSFGVMEETSFSNKSWTERLIWSVENFDIAVSCNVNLLNWAKPFEPAVWAVILMTIILSAAVYQLIEQLSDEREDRSWFQWFSDNLYLSSLSFTQNFEYAPNSVAGRIFGVSTGVWALVITATYTANLASLFVETQRPSVVIDSVEQAVLLGVPICTWEGTNQHEFVSNKYQKAILVPKPSQRELYKALRRGECGLAVGYRDSWLTYEKQSLYNPDCDLEWVGRQIKTIKSGFAVKADAGDLCSSFTRDVLNVHFVEFLNEGGLDRLWEKHRSKSQDLNCAAADEGTGTVSIFDGRRRRLGANVSSVASSTPGNHRRLKAAARAAASSTSSDGSSYDALSMHQMIGTFALHWISMTFALLVSVVAKYYSKWEKKELAKQGLEREQQTFRKHGPIVGMPPRANTFVIRNVNGKSNQPTDTVEATRKEIAEMLKRQDSNAQRERFLALEETRKEISEMLKRPSSGRSLDQRSRDARRERLLASQCTQATYSHESLLTELQLSNDDMQPSEPDTNVPLRDGCGGLSQKAGLTEGQQLFENKLENVETRMGTMDDKMEMLLTMLKQQNDLILDMRSQLHSLQS